MNERIINIGCEIETIDLECKYIKIHKENLNNCDLVLLKSTNSKNFIKLMSLDYPIERIILTNKKFPYCSFLKINNDEWELTTYDKYVEEQFKEVILCNNFCKNENIILKIKK